MSKLGTIAFKSEKGHIYEFRIYPIDAAFKPGHGCVYVITRRHDEPKHHHGHHIIYIGETDDMATELGDHPEQAKFEQEQANCCCVHTTEDAEARKRIAAELKAKYLPQ